MTSTPFALRPSFAGLSLAALLLAFGSAQGADAVAKPGAKAAAPKAAAKRAPAKVVDASPPPASAEQIDAAERVFYGVYECEFKQTVDIEKSVPHASYVTVRSGKSTWTMKPVLSSTGAIRLEDVKGETLMVQIASKSMLLNVKTAHRIVDDCVSQKQRELIEAARVAKEAELAKAAEAAASGASGAASGASTSAAMATPASAAASAVK